MTASVNQWLQSSVASYVERADAFRRIELVSNNSHEIDAKLIDVYCNLAEGLRRVRVKADAMFPRNSADLRNRLNRADFVVGVHDSDQDRACSHRATNIVGIDTAEAVDRQIGHSGAEPLEESAWTEHSRVLDLRRDDVLALVGERSERALDREVVRFTPATREHDLFRSAAEQARNLAARVLNRGPGRHARPMPARRIPERFVQERPHDCSDCGIDRCARVVVEIDHGFLCSFITKPTTTPERNVTAAIATMAQRSPKKSATSPALTAPIA